MDFVKDYKKLGIEVECLHASPLWLSANAIRYSHDNHDKSDTLLKPHSLIVNDVYDGEYGLCTTEYGIYGVCGDKDKDLIQRVGCKMKHESVLEMIDFTFSIHGVSRALLQELVRHRISSLPVQSSRYVLHKLLKEEKPFVYYIDGAEYYDFSRAEKYLMFPLKAEDSDWLYKSQVTQLELLRIGVSKGASNDVLKYLIPESFRTKLQYKINLRSLRNLLELRTSKDALWEFRYHCGALIANIPEEYHYLLEDVIKFDGTAHIP